MSRPREQPEREPSRRRKDRSTSTVGPEGQLVPWLAADGPLSYSPEAPPDRDYFFQYSWVVPGIFADTVNLRRHYYFGAHRRDDARAVFDFWEKARAGSVATVAYTTGSAVDRTVAAPLSAYHATDRFGDPIFVLIQHGSYQLLPADNQPLLASGEVLLYRGVGEAEKFHLVRRDARAVDSCDAWRRCMAVQAHVLSDAVRSFNSIHDRTKRCETGHIRDQSWMTDDLAREQSLDIDSPGPLAELWKAIHQSYALCRWVAESKFGPNFVVLKCPLGNIRITTFFAGEHEARIIDPNLLEIVEIHGCKVVESAS